jgi:hypothetical protein
MKRIWRALDAGPTWERILYKLSLIGSALWIIIGIPANVYNGGYLPYKDMVIIYEGEPDFNSDPRGAFRKRAEENAEINEKNKEILRWAIITPTIALVLYWTALGTLLSFASNSSRVDSN